jgi:hypothetical protein
MKQCTIYATIYNALIVLLYFIGMDYGTRIKNHLCKVTRQHINKRRTKPRERNRVLHNNMAHKRRVWPSKIDNSSR